MIVIAIISFWIKLNFFPFVSDDAKDFLITWFEKIKEYGGIFSLKYPIGNYNVPYMIILSLLSYLPMDSLYALKFSSVIFDYVMAVASMLLVKELFKQNSKKNLYASLVFVITSLLPTVLLNSAAWGQCDSIYTSFILFALLYLIKRNYFKSFIFLGIAFSFKLQTVFILPVYILMYASKREFSICNFALIPVVNILLNVPAVLFGRSLSSCLNIYTNQIGSYKEFLSMNIPNIYTLFLKCNNENNLIINVDDALVSLGIVLTIVMFCIIGVVVIYNKTKIDKEEIILLSIWSVMIATFLLPRMHDRYMYIADVLSVVYLFIQPKKFYIPIFINIISSYTYMFYLYKTPAFDISVVGLLGLITVILITYEVFKKITLDKPRELVL